MKVQYNENRKLQRKKLLELSLIVSLMLHIFLLQGYKKVTIKPVQRWTNIPEVEIVELPVITNHKPKPPPKIPLIEIPEQTEILLAVEPIDITISESETQKPPPPPEIENGTVPTFVVYDKALVPVGGYESIANKLIYPELARKADIEGKVVVEAVIDEQGNVISTRILKTLGFKSCDEAAEKAIRSVKWYPAMQRDRPVKVWIAIPVEFKLSSR